MGKICEKCMKKYEDTWDVCLFCGSKLKKEEECREVREDEGPAPEEIKVSKADVRAFMFLVAVIALVVIILILVLAGGTELWSRFAEKVLWRAAYSR